MKKLLLIDLITDDGSINYLEEVRSALGEQADKFDLTHIHLPAGGFDPAVVGRADLILLSGSYKSAYENFDWKPLCHMVFELVIQSGKPALANCFSAQFLALHLGGRVEKNKNGLEFGPVQIRLTPAAGSFTLLHPYTSEKHLFATHQDCITELPSDCTLLAHNENSPVQAYVYGNILATQFHSDLPVHTARRLLHNRKERYLNEGVFSDETSFQDLHRRLELIGESHQFLLDWLALHSR
jgi:GMP synthase (glutamine-hydrolysing)